MRTRSLCVCVCWASANIVIGVQKLSRGRQLLHWMYCLVFFSFFSSVFMIWCVDFLFVCLPFFYGDLNHQTHQCVIAAQWHFLVFFELQSPLRIFFNAIFVRFSALDAISINQRLVRQCVKCRWHVRKARNTYIWSNGIENSTFLLI